LPPECHLAPADHPDWTPWGTYTGVLGIVWTRTNTGRAELDRELDERFRFLVAD